MMVAILSLILAVVLIVPEVAGIICIVGGLIGAAILLHRRYVVKWR